MGVSTIDGTIESAELRRSAAKIRIYKTIVFRLANGETKTIAKPIAHAELAPRLEPGATGRFYLFSSIDHRGIAGVRTSDGQAQFAYPRNNETIGMVLTILAALWVGLSPYFVGDFGIFALIVLILGPIVWLVNRSLRRQAERQFQADNPVGPATAAVAG
ncbi:hypothetical protein RCO27_11540 [Sphingosinicella sp. LHD-64]|uniref:hypothetical protein n=1 Tax=Sphingosinicella sp. LHD-64 TaxID=3072139 RepID=UPI00280CA6BE|nr:hypothetical protein [Sphingosinicella sp. LHD-64]MDQ8756859.1 hypothetical protein [Sphingosinicella sp. LHD-64]